MERGTIYAQRMPPGGAVFLSADRRGPSCAACRFRARDRSGLTKVVDTVYRADGTTASGTVLISWPAFTTADGKAVAAGSLSVQLGNGGSFAASLAPNTGAQPAGVYYKVVYQLQGQAPSTEYWVVPATGSIGIGSVRAKLMPPTIAAQVLTRDVADSNYVHVTGDQTVAGVKTFSTVNAQSINGALNAAAFPGTRYRCAGECGDRRLRREHRRAAVRSADSAGRVQPRDHNQPDGRSGADLLGAGNDNAELFREWNGHPLCRRGCANPQLRFDAGRKRPRGPRYGRTSRHR